MAELEAAGLGVAAISYDSEDVLADFSQRRGITFPLLSDDGSAVITAFGILNTVAAEGVGPNADDPDVVADVAKYVSAFGANAGIVGAPFPGTFMLDSEGRVSSRFFETPYRERNTTSNVLLKTGLNLSPIAAIEGKTPHLKATAYPSDPVVVAGTRFSVAVDVEPVKDMHVYAPGAESMGYRVVGLNLAPSSIGQVTTAPRRVVVRSIEHRTGHDPIALARTGCEDAVVPDLMRTRRRDQRHEPLDELASFHQDVGGAVAPARFQAQREPSVCAFFESVVGERGPGDVAAETFDASAVSRRDGHVGVEAHAAVLGYARRCLRVSVGLRVLHGLDAIAEPAPGLAAVRPGRDAGSHRCGGEGRQHGFVAGQRVLALALNRELVSWDPPRL